MQNRVDEMLQDKIHVIVRKMDGFYKRLRNVDRLSFKKAGIYFNTSNIKGSRDYYLNLHNKDAALKICEEMKENVFNGAVRLPIDRYGTHLNRLLKEIDSLIVMIKLDEGV